MVRVRPKKRFIALFQRTLRRKCAALADGFCEERVYSVSHYGARQVALRRAKRENANAVSLFAWKLIGIRPER